MESPDRTYYDIHEAANKLSKLTKTIRYSYDDITELVDTKKIRPIFKIEGTTASILQCSNNKYTWLGKVKISGYFEPIMTDLICWHGSFARINLFKPASSNALNYGQEIVTRRAYNERIPLNAQCNNDLDENHTKSLLEEPIKNDLCFFIDKEFSEHTCLFAIDKIKIMHEDLKKHAEKIKPKEKTLENHKISSQNNIKNEHIKHLDRNYKYYAPELEIAPLIWTDLFVKNQFNPKQEMEKNVIKWFENNEEMAIKILGSKKQISNALISRLSKIVTPKCYKSGGARKIN
ncbi:MAG: hypothetical protein PVG30_00700 [Gammaproteobacteria bacterium]|jgi:hypothetical protein